MSTWETNFESKTCFTEGGCRRRLATREKSDIPEALKKEIEISFHQEIVWKLKRIVNLDQTPSKYVSGNKSTLAKIGDKSMPVTGSSDKRVVTLIFSIIMKGEFLPMSNFYVVKVTRSVFRVAYLDSFYKSANKNHYSNEEEYLKLLKYVIFQYVKAEGKTLSKPPQPWWSWRFLRNKWQKLSSENC